MLYDELQTIGERYGFDIYIEVIGNQTVIEVPAWIQMLPDAKVAPVLADLNRALLNLAAHTTPVLKVYTA